jgi:hypothetical protein
VVRLPDAAALRETRRRVALAERLAELEVHADAVAKCALKLATDAFPALVEALELVLATPKITDADDGLIERLVRAEPERARRVLKSLTCDRAGSAAGDEAGGVGAGEDVSHLDSGGWSDQDEE